MERLRALLGYAANRARGGLLSLTLEVTKRCNARCDFCDFWREPRREEMADFSDVVRRMRPLVVVFCGGEPLMRPDIVDLVRRVAQVPGWRYLLLITNGSLLTPQKGLLLQEAGLHQLNVSLNWPDQRQSEERGLKGLFERLERTIPALTAGGVEVNLNTMIMRENLEQVPRIAELGLRWGAKVSYTLYSEYCNGNQAHKIPPQELARLEAVVQQLVALKQRHRHITNNAYYLRQCVRFVAGQRFPDCPAGQRMVHVTPQGMVKPCADLKPVGHYTRFEPRAFTGTGCDMCWMACRGEVQAPVNLARVREVVGL